MDKRKRNYIERDQYYEQYFIFSLHSGVILIAVKDNQKPCNFISRIVLSMIIPVLIPALPILNTFMKLFDSVLRNDRYR